jgi:hypothetical protein
MSVKRKYKTLLAFGAAFALAALLTGCGKDDKEADKKNPPPIVVRSPSCPAEKIEPGDESTPVQSTRHVYDQRTCIEVEQQVFYRTTHNNEDIFLRPDGTKLSSHLENSRGTVLHEVKYAADGKTVVEGYHNRDDGTRLKTITHDDKANTTTTVTCWWDGQSVFSTQVVNADGSFTNEMHHKNGAIWMKRTGTSSGVVTREETFDTNGVLQFVSEPQPGAMTLVTGYRPDGTMKSKQTFYVSTYYYGGGGQQRTLISVEEYAADGKTLARKITTGATNSGYGYWYGGGYPDTVETHNADGTTVVHKVRYDGRVSHEEIRDATGKVTSQKDWTWSDTDAPTEKIDSSLITYSVADPQQTWSQTEQSSQFRDPAP